MTTLRLIATVAVVMWWLAIAGAGEQAALLALRANGDSARWVTFAMANVLMAIGPTFGVALWWDKR